MPQPRPPDPFSEIPIASANRFGTSLKPINERQALGRPVFSRQNLPPKGRSRALAWLSLLGLGALFYLVAGYFLVPILIEEVATKAWARHLDRPVTIGQVAFNPLTLRLTLENGIIGPRLADPADPIDPLLSFSSLTLVLDLRSLAQRAIICQELSLNQPFLHLVHQPGQDYNITALLAIKNGAHPDQQGLSAKLLALIPARYSINNITINNGEIIFDDLPTGQVHRLEKLNCRLPGLANIEYQHGLLSPQFSALLNGHPLHMSGRARMVAGQMTASLGLTLQDLDLAAYLDFIPARLGLQAISGQADLNLHLLYEAAAPIANRFRFTGSVALRGAKINGDHGQFSVDAALFKGEFSPAERRWQADEISLQHPVWQQEAGQASLFGWSRPGEGGADLASPPTWPAAIVANLFSPSGTGPKLPITHLQITGGEIKELGAAAGETAGNWQAIAVSINTAQVTGGQDGQQAIFTLNAKQQSGSRVSLQGSASTAPFEAKGLLVISHLDMATAQKVWQRFGSGAALPVSSGLIEQVQANFSLTLGPDQQPQCRLEPLSIEAKGLRLEHQGQLLEIPVWQSEQGSFTISDKTLHLGKVQLQQATITCRRQSSTGSWQDLPPAPLEQAPAGSALDLTGLELVNASLIIENQGPPDIHLRLERLDLLVDPFDPQQGNSFGASALLSDKYPIHASGTFSLAPFSASLKIQASDLPLSIFQPILEHYFVSRVNGILSAEGNLALPSLDYQGKWSIEALSVVPPSTPKEAFSCQSLRAEGSTFVLRPWALSVDRLSVQGPVLQVTANANGFPGLPAFMQPGWQAAATAAEAQVAIKAIELDDGTVIYDLPAAAAAEGNAVKPRRGLQLAAKGVSGMVENLLVAKDQAISFNVQGLLAGQAEFQAQGVMRPFAARPGLELQSQFSGLPLTALAPILEPYWGFTVQEGALDFANQLTYEDTLIQDSLSLSMHDLAFGKPLVPEAIKAIGETWHQLPLLQALLQDPKRTIQLTVPIDGRTDTGFTYQTALKSLLNQLLLKATVSPLHLLSNGGPVPSDTVSFPPGASQLTDAATAQLQLLATLLQTRPQLILHLAGFADSSADRRALSTAQKKQRSPDAAQGATPITDTALLNLASARAEAVQKIITQQGLSPNQIRVDDPELISADQGGAAGCRVAFSFSRE